MSAKTTLFRTFLFLLVFYTMQACTYYKQDIMFRTDGSTNTSALQLAVNEAEKNYKIRVNDLIELRVYTNEGERIIDPNFEFTQQMGTNGNIIRTQMDQPKYLIQHDGMTKLPMIGMIKLEGFTHQQADSILETKYNQFYEGAFVTARVSNRRAIVLGAIGGGSGSTKLVPLENENMSVIEVIALSGGIANFAKVSNIRLIRGDLDNPQVQIIDLSTIEGMRKAELDVRPNDIIYVEPGRRPLLDAVRDYSTFLNLISSLTTLTILILTITN